MRKVILVVAILAMVLVAIAPALADHNNDNNDNDNNHHNNFNNNDNNGAPAFVQNQEQDADSGDLSQDFNVTGGGDNSNQCVGLQGVGNTGNAQNQIGVMQYGAKGGDLNIEDSGSSIEVSPNNHTECTQSVNQTATAVGS